MTNNETSGDRKAMGDKLRKEAAEEALTGATDMVKMLRAVSLARSWLAEATTSDMPHGHATLVTLVTACGLAPNKTGGPAVRSQLFWDLVSGVEVFRTVGCHALTDEQILDRAANIYAGLTGNYTITPR